MKKILLLLIFGIMVLTDCFSQNMLIIGGEYNHFNPSFWNGSIGFNIELFNEHIQDELLLTFGSITAKNGIDKKEPRFIFSVKDNLFYSLDGKFAGLRAGVTASFGIYDVPVFPKSFDFFLSGAGLVGICILPRSLISITLDVCPGYAIPFNFTDKFQFSGNDLGFMMPVTLGIRLNIDKL
jgi:hypothetical protein